MRIGVAGLAGLPLGDTGVYTIRAQIGAGRDKIFTWNSRPNFKSKDGTYILDNLNQNFELRHHKADESTFVLYTISRFDYKTGEKIYNYAYAMQPIIHVLGKR